VSLPLDHPYVTVGDKAGQVQAWRLSGHNDHPASVENATEIRNTDRGRLYVTLADAAGDLKVSLFRGRDKGAADLVAEGQGPAGTRVVLAEQNASGLTGSVYVSGPGASERIVLHAALATPRDMQERDDRFDTLLRESPVESNPFEAIMRMTSAQFYLRIADKFPPPSRSFHELKTFSSVPRSEPGSFGDRDRQTTAIWRLNVEADWELVGLQNPGDYREWATQDSLMRAWNTRVRGGDQDPVLMRVIQLRHDSEEQFRRVRPFVDLDLDASPDIAARTTSWRLERG